MKARDRLAKGLERGARLGFCQDCVCRTGVFRPSSFEQPQVFYAGEFFTLYLHSKYITKDSGLFSVGLRS